MDKRTPSVEWTIAESEADWERLQGPPLPDRTPATRRRLPLNRYLWGVALFLLLVSVGGWCWRSTQGRAHQAAAAATAQQALVAAAPGPAALVTNGMSNQSGMDLWDQYERASRDLRMAVQAADPAGHLDVAWQTVKIQGGLAAVQVISHSARGAPAYRQTRFYRRTPTGGWMQMAPEAALWGPERSLTTPSFVYHFRQHDAPVVIAVAAQIDTLYRIMRGHFGLALTPATAKLVIDVSVTQPPGDALPWFSAPERISVPSPAVYWAPVELSDADLLVQSLALPLLAHGLAQASERYGIRQHWQPLLAGLYLWQMWDLNLPLAVWHNEIVRGVYVDMPTLRPGQPIVLPDHYEQICAAHALWMPSPLQMDIPLFCNELDRQDRHQVWDNTWNALTRLDQFAVPAPSSEYINTSSLMYAGHPGQTVALATLIEYAVATYGRERLPALVAGLGQYKTWDTLLPAVYGVSPAEFEAGWQAYLAAHYGVSVAHKSGSK